jgi:transcriptional regulator of met regulon
MDGRAGFIYQRRKRLRSSPDHAYFVERCGRIRRTAQALRRAAASGHLCPEVDHAITAVRLTC